MSSRPPPPPPVYPREPPPHLPPPPPPPPQPSTSSTTTGPSVTAALASHASLQLPAPASTQAGPPLPPPSYPRRGSRPPPLPRLTPLSVSALGPAPPYHSPTTYGQSSHERWFSTPRERLAYGPLYTPPRSDPSYSPQYGQPLHVQAEVGTRPALPPLEQRAWPSEGRREVPAYPSPAYPDFRPSEESHPATTPPASRAGPPQLEPSYIAPEPPPSASSVPHQFEIQVRQQPLAARACGFGERDRRVIDPPPIVQLVPRDARPGAADLSELRYPFNVVHCTLWNEDGSNDETAIPSQDRRVTRRLMGTLVASPFVGKDEHDREGCFFCFPDLSCRTHGRYRLKFVLMRMDMTNLRPGGFMPVLATTMSDVFTVYTAKEFPGMRASTPLTRALKRQGCAISVKKGNERATGSGRGPSAAEEGSPPA